MQNRYLRLLLTYFSDYQDHARSLCGATRRLAPKHGWAQWMWTLKQVCCPLDGFKGLYHQLNTYSKLQNMDAAAAAAEDHGKSFTSTLPIHLGDDHLHLKIKEQDIEDPIRAHHTHGGVDLLKLLIHTYDRCASKHTVNQTQCGVTGKW